MYIEPLVGRSEPPSSLAQHRGHPQGERARRYLRMNRLAEGCGPHRKARILGAIQLALNEVHVAEWNRAGAIRQNSSAAADASSQNDGPLKGRARQ